MRWTRSEYRGNLEEWDGFKAFLNGVGYDVGSRSDGRYFIVKEGGGPLPDRDQASTVLFEEGEYCMAIGEGDVELDRALRFYMDALNRVSNATG